jgi:hypothetical protein
VGLYQDNISTQLLIKNGKKGRPRPPFCTFRPPFEEKKEFPRKFSKKEFPRNLLKVFPPKLTVQQYRPKIPIPAVLIPKKLTGTSMITLDARMFGVGKVAIRQLLKKGGLD